jgi:hypothetical protein
MARFIGEIELSKELQELSKKSRLQRIQEVRDYERNISIERSSDYRKYIDERKQIKYEKKLREKKEKLIQEKIEKKKQLEYYLVKTGEAHRFAKEELEQKKEAEQRKLMKEVQYMERTEERSRVAERVIRHQKHEEQKRTLAEEHLQYVKEQFRKEAREDAHLFGESKAHKRERSLSPTSRYRITRSLTVRSAERVHERFPTEIHPVVIRHNASAETTICDNADVQEKVTLKKSWKQIMDELRRRTTIKKRYREARVVLTQVNGTKFLEDELEFLYSLDKSRGRVKEMTEVQLFDEENMDIRDEFEKTFMSGIAVKKTSTSSSTDQFTKRYNKVEESQADRFSTTSSSASSTEESEDSLNDIEEPSGRRYPGFLPAAHTRGVDESFATDHAYESGKKTPYFPFFLFLAVFKIVFIFFLSKQQLPKR